MRRVHPEFLNGGQSLLILAVGLASIVFMSGSKGFVRHAKASATPTPSFEVASIRLHRPGDSRSGFQFPPGRFAAIGVTTKQLLELAFEENGTVLMDNQISGGPNWINSDKYDINAKVEEALVSEWNEEKLSVFDQTERIILMLRQLLVERFQLSMIYGTEDLPVYNLIVGKNGPKLNITPRVAPGPDGKQPLGRTRFQGKGQLTASGEPLSVLVMVLMAQLGRPVIDKTGLTSRYDFTLKWTPDSSTLNNSPESDEPRVGGSDAPSIWRAIQDQLGLKLESAKGAVNTIVVKHIEKPSGN